MGQESEISMILMIRHPESEITNKVERLMARIFQCLHESRSYGGRGGGWHPGLKIIRTKNEMEFIYLVNKNPV